ncbi:MAG: hypothetical protein ABI240_01140 [Sphingomonas sp.]
MSLFVLMLLQAAVPAPAEPPAPNYQISNLPGGAFLITVASLQADRLAAVEEDIDRAAADKCEIGGLSATDQTYDQETDSAGNPAPVITNLQLTYKCPPPPEPPKHP